ncbi:MAG: trigger factor [Candidatus Pacebacteria bacterium]|nr:trigger factor [Candidatus Paceibacterota bacterium]
MKFETKNLPESQKEILVHLEFEELKPYLETKIREKKKNLEFKGFRKGKVPEEIISFLLEENLLEEVANEAIKDTYLKILKETKLEVLGTPKIEILKLVPNNPMEFKITLCVLPEITLPDYKEIAPQVKRRKVGVEEREVEETLRWIQKSRAKRIPKDEPAQIGDLVEVIWSSSEIEKGREHTERVILGESYLLPEIEKAIVGMKKGEEKEVEAVFPANYFNKNLAGKRVKLKIKLRSVEKIEISEISDEWARSIGRFENLEDLKKNIREGILQEKEKIESQRVQGEILTKIANKTEVDVPKTLSEIELERSMEELKNNISQILGISFDEYLRQINQTEEELRTSLLKEVQNKVKKFLILREIRKKENIEAKEEEIKEEADKFLTQFRSPEEAEKHIDPEALLEYIRERIENQKTLEFLESFAQKEL